MKHGLMLVSLVFLGLLLTCSSQSNRVATKNVADDSLSQLIALTELEAERIGYLAITGGQSPADFKKYAGALYKPSFNEDPAIPVQCWIETGYGTQNACKYCHTNYLTEIEHGNNFPIGEDQILYSFQSPNLNRINWENVIYPQKIDSRLAKQGTAIPSSEENLRYVRTDNWRRAYRSARQAGDSSWNNLKQKNHPMQLFPALNPNHLYSNKTDDPTDSGTHGFIDSEGFVRNEKGEPTGWRAVNFFPYAIFTPLTGSVSGIYIRLPEPFRTDNGILNLDIYRKNLNILEKNIKNRSLVEASYIGDAASVPVEKGFYPLGTEFAHPLHYVDLRADGEFGRALDGVYQNETVDYEFPGTRSKRVKEIRYMYKWKRVTLDDIGEKDSDEEPFVYGKAWKGWIDNHSGWILAAYIENRDGQLRPQTTEELLQCLGCHSSVGNTIDAVWSFQRKLEGAEGWQEMNYGQYDSRRPNETRLRDYRNETAGKGEMEYFYGSVVGADLFGTMPNEIKNELINYLKQSDLATHLKVKTKISLIFDDEFLKIAEKQIRRRILLERSKIMNHYASHRQYLVVDSQSGESYIKGSIFYPAEKTMLANIAGYRKIVLDQSFNLGKVAFGSQPDHIPFTFRSDGSVRNENGELIPAGRVIDSRPYNPEGVGITPTGIVQTNANGEAVDADGQVVDIEKSPQLAVGHISSGGTFDPRYNPIIGIHKINKQMR
ncbi:MAG: hypothetical protein PVF60_05360 [Desulfobacterales bacterium]|jgi:hypothetical protein